MPNIFRKLHDDRIVQSEALTQLRANVLSDLLADHIVHWIAYKVKQAEGNQCHNKHDDDCLQKSSKQ
jgi:hypothetical protein